jgi:hypothetical protein
MKMMEWARNVACMGHFWWKYSSEDFKGYHHLWHVNVYRMSVLKYTAFLLRGEGGEQQVQLTGSSVGLLWTDNEPSIFQRSRRFLELFIGLIFKTIPVYCVCSHRIILMACSHAVYQKVSECVFTLRLFINTIRHSVKAKSYLWCRISSSIGQENIWSHLTFVPPASCTSLWDWGGC